MLASEYSEPTTSMLPSVCASSALRQAETAASLTSGEKPTFGIGEAGCCGAGA